MQHRVERVVHRAGEEFQERLRYKIDQIYELSPGLALWLRRWDTEQNYYTKPWRVESADADIVDCVIDVGSENPLHYVVNDHSESDIPGYGTDMNGKPLISFTDRRLHMICLAGEYIDCKEYGEPVFHEIRQRFQRVERHYMRLLLPVTDEKRNVVNLHSVVQRLERARIV